jgi:hypothetical protein
VVRLENKVDNEGIPKDRAEVQSTERKDRNIREPGPGAKLLEQVLSMSEALGPEPSIKNKEKGS